MLVFSSIFYLSRCLIWCLSCTWSLYRRSIPHFSRTNFDNILFSHIHTDCFMSDPLARHSLLLYYFNILHTVLSVNSTWVLALHVDILVILVSLDQLKSAKYLPDGPHLAGYLALMSYICIWIEITDIKQ